MQYREGHRKYGGGCGGLEGNDLYRFIHFKTWSPVLKELEGVALMEKLHHWGQALRFQKTSVILSLSVCHSLKGVVDR